MLRSFRFRYYKRCLDLIAHDWCYRQLGTSGSAEGGRDRTQSKLFYFDPFYEAEFRCKFILDKLPSNWYAQVTWDDGVPTLRISFVVFGS